LTKEKAAVAFGSFY